MKRFEVVFLPSVWPEVEENIKDYELKSPGLGQRFYESFSLKIETLKTNPYYQIRYNQLFRMIQVKDFPYIIHFEVDELQLRVIVHAVFMDTKILTNGLPDNYITTTRRNSIT